MISTAGIVIGDQYKYMTDTYEFMQELTKDVYRRINGPCMNGECSQEELDQAVQELYV